MTVQLVRNYYDAFNRRDFAGMLALLGPDVVHDINQGGREVGKPAFQQFLERMDAAYREELRDLVVLAEATGRRFAAEFTVHGKYLKADPEFPPAHGQSYQLPAGAFLEVKDGLIQRVTTYYNLHDWLEQVKKAR
jgi:steroid delta-isomerase-like uncharacterized protein